MITNINNREFFIWLPDRLFKDLKLAIEKQNQNNDIKLSLSVSAYILNLPYYIQSNRKDKYEDGWVPICSEIQKNIKNFSKYIKFLIDNDFFKRHKSKYSSYKNTCYKFKICKKYETLLVKPQVVKSHKSFLVARLKEINDRIEKADKKTKHLTKWLKGKNFEVDSQSASKFIKKKYSKPTKKDRYKRNMRGMTIDKLKGTSTIYSREGKDNRLHSIITSLPKDLRNFVKFQKSSLISIDIKNSQPFILASIINNLQQQHTHSKEHNTGIILFLTNTIPIMFDQLTKMEITHQLDSFKKQVFDGVYYKCLGKILYQNNILSKKMNGDYIYIKYNKEKEFLESETYENLREAGKKINMQSMFCKKFSGELGSVFKKEYPSTAKIIDKIRLLENNEKGVLSILLQNIEADFVLDYATKKISVKHPDVPLFTIHDSVVTTIDHFDTVKTEFEKHCKSYFGRIPSLKEEPWYNNLNSAA